MWDTALAHFFRKVECAVEGALAGDRVFALEHLLSPEEFVVEDCRDAVNVISPLEDPVLEPPLSR